MSKTQAGKSPASYDKPGLKISHKISRMICTSKKGEIEALYFHAEPSNINIQGSRYNNIAWNIFFKERINATMT